MKLEQLREFVTVQDVMGDDLSAVRAARVSYGKQVGEEFDEKRDYKLLKYLLSNGHWSPFEHATITFRVEAPIFVARQWMRHKSWSFNEISGRYTELPTAFYVPETWRGQDSKNKQASSGVLPTHAQEAARWYYDYAIRAAKYAYEHLLELGASRELARMALPVSTFTQFYATANLRSIMHFLEQRLDPHAQPEIQEYAMGVEDGFKNNFPWTFDAWRESGGLRDSTCICPCGCSDGGSTPPASTNIETPVAYSYEMSVWDWERN